MDVFPLVFEPIVKPKIWGGRRLETLLRKRLPPGEQIGESWEIADLEDDQSVVAAGPAKGMTLSRLVRDWGTDMLGDAPLFEDRFPLLIKFLDAAQTLSVQVHPDQAMAKRLGGRVRVKNEAWYVIDSEPGGFIYRGVRPGVDAAFLRESIAEGRVEAALNRINVKKGHCYYLPSGTIHALGAGVLVAEVQTPSDITYRVYDWNRIDESTGRPRPLHLEQALECISYDSSPIAGEQPHHVASVWTAVTTLVRCESFGIDRVRMVEGVDQELPTGGFAIWMMLEGRASIACAGLAGAVEVGIGDTVLIPAGVRHGRVRTHEPCLWLEATISLPSALAEFGRPSREELAGPPGGAGLVQLNPPPQTGGD